MEMPDEMNARERQEYGEASNLSKLTERMYSRERTGFLPWRRRREVPQKRSTVDESWQYEEPVETQKTAAPKYRFGGSGVVLVVAIVFFVAAMVGAFSFLGSSFGVVTAGGIDITLEGPNTVTAGEVLQVRALITNRNDVPLETATLLITYPDGTVSPADFRSPLESERIELGRIEARTARRGAFRAVILGAAGMQGVVNIELQYRLQGSSILHSHKVAHAVLIASDALTLSVEGQKEAIAGQSMQFDIRITSNAATILNNVVLNAQYPFGFSKTQSVPTAQPGERSDSDLWEIGVLRPGESRTVSLIGTLDGQAGDERTLVFEVGTRASQTLYTDATKVSEHVLARYDHMLRIHKPFLAATLTFGSASVENAVAYAGERLPVTVRWYNNLTEPISDATIAVTLGGTALNKAGVNAGDNGFYRSVDSLILWDSKTTGGELAYIPPGASGEYRFDITPLPQSYLEQIEKPTLTFKVNAAGNRLSEARVPEVIRESTEYTVKIGSDATLVAEGLLESNPFGSNGPRPPKVEYETTYAIAWQVTNTTSDLENASVTAQLPPYVRWVGLSSPLSEQLTYNKIDNTITWQLGDVVAGTGVRGNTPRKVTFALGLVPSASQIGISPLIIQNQQLRAVDAYTGASVSWDASDLTTDLSLYDAAFDPGNAAVVE